MVFLQQVFEISSRPNLRHLIYIVTGTELALSVASRLVVGPEIAVDALAAWAPG